MSTTPMSTGAAAEDAGVSTVPMRFEVTSLPGTDVDRAMAFCQGLGWRLDADFAAGDEFRVVQLTPPGSQASIQFGRGRTLSAASSHRVRALT